MLETFKKAGAYLLIGLLTLLMGAYAFVDRSATMATRQSLLSGAGPGEFAGETITWKVYYSYFGYCKEQEERYMAQLGNIDRNMPIFAGIKAENCVRRNLNMVYSLKLIGNEFRLRATTESIKRDLIKQARELANSQQVIHEDERLTPQDFYRRLMSQASFEVRKLEKVANQTRRILGQAILLPASVLEQESLPGRVVFQLRLIRWDSQSLMDHLKSQVQLTEPEIRAQYKTEQAKLDPEKRQPLSKERPFLVERMKAERARKRLTEIKTKLSALKTGFSLSEVSKLTGLPILDAGRVSLDTLDAVKTKEGTFNLDKPKFYRTLEAARKGAYSSGPYQDGSYTIYTEVRDLKLDAAPSNHDKQEETLQKKSEELGREIANELIRAAGKRGALQLELKTEKKSGPKNPPK